MSNYEEDFFEFCELVIKSELYKAPAKSREIVGVYQKMKILFNNDFCPH